MMEGWGGMPMMGWGGYDGGGWIMMLLFGLVAIALAVLIFRAFAWNGHPAHYHVPAPSISAGLHTLDDRYARGEINRDEYLQKRRDIAG